MNNSVYCSWDLLIIDEFGFDKLERKEFPDALSLLYKVIDGRNCKSSTAIITNVNLDDWTGYLGYPPLTMHVGKNVYRCIGCGSGGNVLDFWQAYSGKSPPEPAIELVEQLKTSNRTGENKEPVIPQHPSSHPAKMA